MTQTPPFQGPSLLTALWRGRFLLALALVAGAALGFVAGQQREERWVSSSSVFFEARAPFDPTGQQSFANDPDRFLVNQARIMTSTQILQGVITDVSLDMTPRELSEQVDAVATGDSDIVVVTAEDSDPERAAAIADAVVAVYRDEIGRQVGDTVDLALDETLAANTGEDGQIRTAAAVYGDGIGFVELADVPDEPVSPAPLRDAVLVGLLALFATAALLLVRAARGGRHGWVDRVSTAVGAPVLSIVPSRGRVRPDRAIAEASSPAAEAYRIAAVHLSLARGDEPGVVVLAGDRPGVGVSETAANLAAASAAMGVATALVRVGHATAAQPDRTGRAPALVAARMRAVRDDRPLGAFRVPSLDVRPEAPGVLLNDLGPALEMLPPETHLVLVDCPQVAIDAVAFAVVSQSTGVVVVADRGTTVRELDVLTQRCLTAGTEILGVVAVMRPWWHRAAGTVHPLRQAAQRRIKRANASQGHRTVPTPPALRQANPASASVTNRQPLEPDQPGNQVSERVRP